MGDSIYTKGGSIPRPPHLMDPQSVVSSLSSPLHVADSNIIYTYRLLRRFL